MDGHLGLPGFLQERIPLLALRQVLRRPAGVVGRLVQPFA